MPCFSASATARSVSFWVASRASQQQWPQCLQIQTTTHFQPCFSSTTGIFTNLVRSKTLQQVGCMQRSQCVRPRQLQTSLQPTHLLRPLTQNGSHSRQYWYVVTLVTSGTSRQTLRYFEQSQLRQ